MKTLPQTVLLRSTVGASMHQMSTVSIHADLLHNTILFQELHGRCWHTWQYSLDLVYSMDTLP